MPSISQKLMLTQPVEVGELYLIGGAVYPCTDRKNLGKGSSRERRMSQPKAAL